jgi:hypothetical protein
VRLRPSHQLQYPRRLLQDGFTTTAKPETITLAGQVTVQRAEPFQLMIMPGVTDPQEERSRRLSLPRSYLADPAAATRLPGAIVETDCFVICPTDCEYLYDSLRHHGKLAGRGYAVFDDGAIEREETAIDERHERVVVLGAQSGANYSHWLLDCLARALLFGPLDDGSRLYLTPPLSRWQRETLELIGLGEERILEWKPRRPCRFEEVIAVSRAMMNVYTLVPAAIGVLSALAQPVSSRRRIYSSRARAHHRHITNEAEVVQVLERHGFEVVHPESLPIKEQIELFAGAETVIGVHGSGLTNTIFSPPGARVIELQPEGLAYGENAVVRTLAGICGQSLVQAVCPVAAEMEALPLQHRDIVVEPRQLEKLVDHVLSG